MSTDFKDQIVPEIRCITPSICISRKDTRPTFMQNPNSLHYQSNAISIIKGSVNKGFVRPSHRKRPSTRIEKILKAVPTVDMVECFFSPNPRVKSPVSEQGKSNQSRKFSLDSQKTKRKTNASNYSKETLAYSELYKFLTLTPSKIISQIQNSQRYIRKIKPQREKVFMKTHKRFISPSIPSASFYY